MAAMSERSKLKAIYQYILEAEARHGSCPSGCAIRTELRMLRVTANQLLNMDDMLDQVTREVVRGLLFTGRSGEATASALEAINTVRTRFELSKLKLTGNQP